MEAPRPTYPCKPFPYRRFPTDDPYPCKESPGTPVPAEPTEAVDLTEVMEEPVVEEEEEEEVVAWRRFHPPKSKCDFPYSRACTPNCRHRYPTSTFNSYWYRQFLNEWERPKETLICITPPLKDSYELLCGVPICDTPPEEPEAVQERMPFDAVHCVFCDKSLYFGGTIYDLHETVPAIKRQSDDRGDDVSYRIGIRTRVTVHRSCYDDYLKEPISDVPEYDDENDGWGSEEDVPCE